MSTLKNIHNPSAELYRRAHISWEYIRRNPAYAAEARQCLKAMPPRAHKRFAALMEEYPRDDVDRWRWAKVNDPSPLPIVVDHELRKSKQTPWRAQLWRFYQKWRLCYPIPRDVDHPHPLVLAWLAPRPAEPLSYDSGGVVFRIDATAPIARILSCIESDIRAARKMFQARQTSSQRPALLRSHGQAAIVRVPLRLDIREVKRFIDRLRRTAEIKPGVKRERNNDKRNLAAWDIFANGVTNGAAPKTTADLARYLGCTEKQALYALANAYRRILAGPYPGKRKAPHALVSSDGPDPLYTHVQGCAKCSTGRPCRECKRLVTYVTRIADTPMRECRIRGGHILYGDPTPWGEKPSFGPGRWPKDRKRPS